MNCKSYIYIHFLLLLIVISGCLSACQGGDVKVVRKIPPGFIYLETGGGNWENGLHYVGWESQISFLDADHICIYQTEKNNSDFIIRYKDDLYVNEEKFLEMFDMATAIADQRNKIYNLGDAVEIRGNDGTNSLLFNIIIEDIQMGETDEARVYEIKFFIEPSATEIMIKRAFVYVETENGMTYDQFSIIDSNTVSIMLPLDEKINTIALTGPAPSITKAPVNLIRKVHVEI